MAKQPVILNVYHLSQINKYISRFGVGAYHSGVEVYNKEYSFGGHLLEISGIFEMEPKSVESLGLDSFQFKESVRLGSTDFTRAEIATIIQDMGKQFKGNKYHLLRKNCNHFTDAFAKILCGKSIPIWVNRLAYYCTQIPFLESNLPKELLTPVALQESIRVQVNKENDEQNRKKNEQNEQNEQNDDNNDQNEN